MENEGLIFFGIIIAFGLFIWAIVRNRNNETVNFNCYWCGTNCTTTRQQFKEDTRSGRGNYCSGRCRRDDENTRGQKAKITRKIK